ncbi:MAG TPA: hypothetical protein VGA44_07425 [Steroidobacteraceae bacterium]
MIEDRHIDLIHAELDGELTSEQRAELSRVLLANPEARARRDELNRLFGALAKVASVEPPPDLAPSVLQAVGLEAREVPALAARAGFRRAAWYRPTLLRYAAVFVGGLLASAAVLQLGSGGGANLDVSQLVGTIGGHAGAAPEAPIDRIELDLAQVSGSASSYEVESVVVLELALSARQPVEVVAIQGARSVSFRLAARPGAPPEQLLWVAGDAGTRESAIELKVFGSGTLLYEGALETSQAK